MKSLIICGMPGVGKSELGNWIRYFTNIPIIDEQTRVSILSMDKSRVFRGKIVVFITQDILTYADVDPSRYHIVTLQKTL